MKRDQPVYLIIIALLFILAGPACESALGPDENAQTAEEQISQAPAVEFPVGIGQYRKPNDIDVFFNPQPEPPAQIFAFETDGLPGHDWEGRFESSEFAGGIMVENLSSKQRGKTLHVVQLWTLYPPDPVLPVRITLKGILNHASSKMVLNGTAAPDGVLVKNETKAHVRGEFAMTADGTISVGGELMFNPQPEPPHPRRSLATDINR